MNELTVFGHSNQRVTWAIIAVGLALLVLTMVLLGDDPLTLYAGVAIGVGMVVGSGVVNYIAVRNAERAGDRD